MKQLIFIVHDGIKNSVFNSQVLQPTLNKIKNKKINNALFISFEKEKISPKYINNLSNNNIKFITLKKTLFWGKFSLYPAILQVKKILKKYKSYNLIARGPISGFIASKSINFSHCNSFVIQARGLLAQEYKYTHKNENNIIKYIIHKIRYYMFYKLEKSTYKLPEKLPKTKIEPVSQELKNYLITNFGAKKENIKLAISDIPEKFDPKQIKIWRNKIRNELQISDSTEIYCYNGSVKPWQCPDQVIKFFKNKLQNYKPALKTNNFLLVLTQNTKKFETLIKQENIPKHTYTIKTVDHNNIYQYLAACDYGVIFRENNIINWVSRPTKILEYQSVGLKIIHNNTVGILFNQFSQEIY